MIHKIEMFLPDIFMACRLLTGAILAHELMHAWLRLKGNIHTFSFMLVFQLLSIHDFHIVHLEISRLSQSQS